MLNNQNDSLNICRFDDSSDKNMVTSTQRIYIHTHSKVVFINTLHTSPHTHFYFTTFPFKCGCNTNGYNIVAFINSHLWSSAMRVIVIGLHACVCLSPCMCVLFIVLLSHNLITSTHGQYNQGKFSSLEQLLKLIWWHPIPKTTFIMQKYTKSLLLKC